MCTVTLIAGRSGYALGMNRDEKLTRAAALPPKRVRLGNCEAIFPSEPGGGTWVGVNDRGICLALINWYAVPDRVRGNVISRGEIVRNLLSEKSIEDVVAELSSQPLARVNPFRLIGVSPQKRVVEWRWNLHELHAYDHAWRTRVWISSGFDEPGAQKTRGNVFAEALNETNAESIEWLRRIHASHAPCAGPYSMCVHRNDAATVSYTEILRNAESTTLRYLDGAPCNSKLLFDDQSLQLKQTEKGLSPVAVSADALI